MKKPIILYPFPFRGIADQMDIIIILLDISTNRMYHNPARVIDWTSPSSNNIRNLINQSYSVINSHLFIESLRIEHNNSVPHTLLDLNSLPPTPIKFILPEAISNIQGLMDSLLADTDEYSFRPIEYFEPYMDDMTTFAEKMSYSQHVNHATIGATAINKFEGFYGHHDEFYTKVYQLKSSKGNALEDNSIEYDQITQSLSSLDTCDPLLDSQCIRICTNVPRFLNTHNQLMNLLKDLDLISEDFTSN